MAPIDPAKREIARLALLQASTRLDLLTRVVASRARREPAARRMLAVLDVVRPLLTAIESLIPDGDAPASPSTGSTKRGAP
jgi:hypothetical protein